MLTTLPFHITALFLLIIQIMIGVWLWRRAGYHRLWFSVQPIPFLVSTLSILLLALGFLVAFRFEYPGIALALALTPAIALMHPVSGVASLISYLVLRPWEYLPDHPLMLLLPKAIAGIAIASWIFASARQRRWVFIWNLPVVAFLSLIAWLAVSSFAASAAVGSLELLQETFFPIVAVVFLIIHSVIDASGLRLLISTFVLAITGVMASSLATTHAQVEWIGTLRLQGMGLLGNANDLAALIVMILPFAIAPLIRRGTLLRHRIFTLCGLGILIYALQLAQSRGAMLAVFGGVFAFALVLSKKRRALLIPLCAGALLIGLLSTQIDRHEGEMEASSESRWNYVIAGLRMARANPLFGVGFGMYPSQYELYTPAFYEWGKRTAHSSWVLVLAETGIPGFLAFLVLYSSVLFRAWRLRGEHPEYLVSVVSYGITMSFLSHTYTLIPYLLFALTIAASRVYREVAVAPVPSTQRMPATVVGLAFFLSASLVRADVTSLYGVSSGEKPLPNATPALSTSLSLMGSRGETLNFQLHVTGTGCVRRPLLEFAPEEVKPSLRTFKMVEFPTLYPSFPGAIPGTHFDPLVPVSLEECLTGNTPQWFWGELTIPRGMPPGRYQAALRFGSASLPVSLEVWRMVMSEKPALAGYVGLTPYWLLLGHYGVWHSGEGALAKAYAQVLAEHFLYPLSVVVARPPIVSGAGGPQLNMESAPNKEDAFLNLTVGARPAWTQFTLPFIERDEVGKPETTQYLCALGNTLENSAWGERSIAYVWDEPQPEEHARVVELLKETKRCAPRAKRMVTTPAVAPFLDLVDIFVPVMDDLNSPSKPGLRTYQELQRAGKQFWWYVSCMSHGCNALSDYGMPDMVIDRPAASIRSLGWLSYTYGVDAFFYYHATEAYRYAPERNLWQNLWDFSGNGDGTLLYPGRPGLHGLEKHTPIASIRLKLWRESVFDVQYLRWMDAVSPAPTWWPGAVSSLAGHVRKWSRDYSAYAELRRKIGDLLNSSNEV